MIGTLYSKLGADSNKIISNQFHIQTTLTSAATWQAFDIASLYKWNEARDIIKVGAEAYVSEAFLWNRTATRDILYAPINNIGAAMPSDPLELQFPAAAWSNGELIYGFCRNINNEPYSCLLKNAFGIYFQSLQVSFNPAVSIGNVLHLIIEVYSIPSQPTT